MFSRSKNLPGRVKAAGVLALALAVALPLAACSAPADPGAHDAGSERSQQETTGGGPQGHVINDENPVDAMPESGDDDAAASPATPPEKIDDAAAPEADTPAGAVDALTISGPTDIPDVPDMEPVITDAVPTFPNTVTDSQGDEITIESADRVIALDLYGTLVDTIIGLGLTDHLVGRGVSDTQEIIKDLPVVSLGGIDLNIEAVLSLHPDLILTNMTIGSRPLYDQLEAAGVTVVRFDSVPTIAGIADELHQVGSVFGLADAADELAAHVDQQMEAARAQIAALRSATPRAPRSIVVYVRGHAGLFFIFGPDYGAAGVLDELGLDDVAATAGVHGITPANAESLIDLDPEIVLTMRRGLETAGGVEGLLDRPGMSGTVAGQRSRIITAADSQLLSYGPRTPANLIALAHAIYTNG